MCTYETNVISKELWCGNSKDNSNIALVYSSLILGKAVLFAQDTGALLIPVIIYVL